MEQYFTNNPDLKSDVRLINYKYGSNLFEFCTDAGVFSKTKIDYASSFLVDTFIKYNKDMNGKSMLDLGCGYGYIGIVIGKVLNMDVTFADINKRALHLTKRNMKMNKSLGKVIESNIYENIDKKFDYIITNPPIRAGKDIVLKFINDGIKYLNTSGEIWFVINKNQGANSIAKLLEKDLKIEILEKSRGFYIFRAKTN